jgi:hypothetical protein
MWSGSFLISMRIWPPWQESFSVFIPLDRILFTSSIAQAQVRKLKRRSSGL